MLTSMKTMCAGKEMQKLQMDKDGNLHSEPSDGPLFSREMRQGNVSWM